MIIDWRKLMMSSSKKIRIQRDEALAQVETLTKGNVFLTEQTTRLLKANRDEGVANAALMNENALLAEQHDDDQEVLRSQARQIAKLEAALLVQQEIVAAVEQRELPKPVERKLMPVSFSAEGVRIGEQLFRLGQMAALTGKQVVIKDSKGVNRLRLPLTGVPEQSVDALERITHVKGEPVLV